jgi:hypothetical protein
LIVLSLRAEARGLLSHRATAKLLTASTNRLKNSVPDRAPGLRPGRMREQQGRPRHRKKLRPHRSQTTPPRPRGLHPAGALARTHRNKIQPRKVGPLAKIRENLQASARTPFEARELLSGTVIRGTPNTPKHGQKTPAEQTIKTDGRVLSQGFVYPRDATLKGKCALGPFLSILVI